MTEQDSEAMRREREVCVSLTGINHEGAVRVYHPMLFAEGLPEKDIWFGTYTELAKLLLEGHARDQQQVIEECAKVADKWHNPEFRKVAVAIS